MDVDPVEEGASCNPIPTSARLAQRLVGTVNRYQAQMVKALKPYDLGASEYPVLITLRHRERRGESPDGCSQRDVAKRQHRDPALINRVAKSLVAKGLITMEVDQRSRNRRLMKLTDEGRQLADEVIALVTAWEDRAVGPLNAAEEKQLMNLLSRLDIG
ncbi:hypothetical protein VJ918_08645 [Adlercreutzia sp. R21]|uniref:MarR family winged helix-turn-helix transcriptional regulator n=1 Tax=Adlercreutzia wanghongyangiae TaxID=3111451 RepID=UPI002DBA9E93|nr:hypothetical protein [Adlercreutzia sp. R21]MEC4184875.1 hypothetical protein [Adlercreutzia sp. R21]